MAQPPGKGVSFGKFLRRRLEVNYMNRLPVNNGAACNASTRARETNADLLRQNCTPVRGYMKGLPVQFKNGHVVRAAEACRTPDDDLQHRLEFGPRSTDDL